MRRIILSLAVVCAIALIGCSESQKQGSESYTERLAGSAEAVNGVIYVFGGVTLQSNVPYVGSYDPASRSWTSRTPLSTPRALGASAVLGSDIYFLGGRNKQGVLSMLEKYSTAKDKWEKMTSMPTARWSLMATSVGDKLYAIGGVSGVGDNRRALDIVEVYEPEANSWQSLGSMPEPRQGAAVAAVDGLIYIISGKTVSYAEESSGDPITDHVDVFDPGTDTWKRVANIPVGRAGATAVVNNGLIFVAGGIDRDGKFPTAIEIFDPGTNEWTAGPSLSLGRSGHMSAQIGSSLIVFGGSTTRYGAGRPEIVGSLEAISIEGYRPREVYKPVHPDEIACTIEDYNVEGEVDNGAVKPIGGAIGGVRCGLGFGATAKELELARHEFEDGGLVTSEFGTIQVRFSTSLASGGYMLMMTDTQKARIKEYLAK